MLNLQAIKTHLKNLGYEVSLGDEWGHLEVKAHEIWAQFTLGLTAIEANMGLAYPSLLPDNHPGKVNSAVISVEDLVSNTIQIAQTDVASLVSEVTNSPAPVASTPVETPVASTPVETPASTIGGDGPDKKLESAVDTTSINVSGE